MPTTLRKTTLTEKYLDLVKEIYDEPKEEEILASYVNEKVRQMGSKLATGKGIAKKKVRNTDVIEVEPPRISVLIYLTAM